ncbi:MAG: hypothetical protein P4L49_01340 [Desulfosporosinus sp.]|nr:hypothetical protein [Desulfosporosinus sp.]
MARTIEAQVNVALADYDESMKNHLVELLKETLREQSAEYIFEDTWKVVENKRKLYKNKDGTLEAQDKETLGDSLSSEISETREVLEIITVVLTVTVADSL